MGGAPSNFVNATVAAKLLGLGNRYDPLNYSLDYGFTLEFKETLQVNSSPLGNDKYSVSVLSDYALPVIGANVSAVLYYVNSSSLIAHLGPVYNTTIYDGSCILDLSGSSTGAKTLAIAVDYYGAYTTKIYSSVGTSVLNATLFGSSLIPSSSPPYPPINGREIILIQTNQGHETRDFNLSITGLDLNSAPEPSAVAVLAVSGNNLLVASRDFSNISYRTIPAIRSAASAYSLERTVLIGGSTFTATLYFWRMST